MMLLVPPFLAIACCSKNFESNLTELTMNAAPAIANSGEVNPHVVHKLLGKYVSDTKSFCALLKATSSAVVGSLALQMLLGVEYAASDMDICTHRCTFLAILRYLEADGYSVSAIYGTLPDDYNVGVQRYVKVDELCGYGTVCKLSRGEGGVGVDILVAPLSQKPAEDGEQLPVDTSAIDLVVLNFDLTCCMCLFDGARLSSYFHDLIVNGIALLKVDYDEEDRVRQRIAKYSARGFHIAAYPENVPKWLIDSHKHLEGLELVVADKKKPGEASAIVNPDHVHVASTSETPDAENHALLEKVASVIQCEYVRRLIVRATSCADYGAPVTEFMPNLPVAVTASSVSIRLVSCTEEHSACFVEQRDDDLSAAYTVGMEQLSTLHNERANAILSKYNYGLLVAIEKIGFPLDFTNLALASKVYCRFLSCSTSNRRGLAAELIERACLPPGVCSMPLYNAGGALYREAKHRAAMGSN